jgi:predicted Zn-ribbon and HTH transcriptional regulator
VPTRRQEIADALREREWSFEQLRHEFQCGAAEIEDDLRHVERSTRRGPDRLRVRPARCDACGFEFRGREPRHFRSPSRCPRCRGERIFPALFRIEAR